MRSTFSSSITKRSFLFKYLYLLHLVFLIPIFTVFFPIKAYGLEEPAIVKNINVSIAGSNPSELVNIDGVLFFACTDKTHGTELWKSDGTAAGTVMVADIRPGTYSSYPSLLTNVNGKLFFKANDGTNGYELWTSDGTESGTVMVADIYAGPATSSLYNLTAVGSTLFFRANDGTNGTELWKSDGTPAGTSIVADIYPGNNSNPDYLTNVNGTLFFRANDGANGYELWKSDGTVSGTTMVADINAGIQSSMLSWPHLTNVNGTLFFYANDGISGYELWKSDGTTAGTVMVADIMSGGGSSFLEYLTNVNGILYFRANDGVHGYELWKSDGTGAGTVMVTDINTISVSSSPSYLTDVNGTLYFVADDGTNGIELWKSDGTAAGTVMVKDINTASVSSSPQYLTNVNGTLYFVADDGTNGIELWKSDGTAAGTSMVADINAATASSDPASLTDVNGTVFFTANDGTNGIELWKSDGTSTGTTMVADIYTGYFSSSPAYLTNVNGTLFFSADDGGSGVELWKSDGTEAGTEMVADIRPGQYGSSPADLTNVNGTLFFQAYGGGTDGYELWKSDGTVEGTVMVADINAVSGSSYPGNLTDVNGTLFFSANDGIHGYELWKSDGTEAGTVMVADIFDGTGSSDIAYLTKVKGTLFFRANDGINGYELWKSDGTEAGTQMVYDIYPGTTGSYPAYLKRSSGTLFFIANDGQHGTELWRSDGTAEGTFMVADINTVSGSSSPHYLTNVNGTLYFQANDGTNGAELWKSDGTEEGTTMVADIHVGAGSSAPFIQASVDTIVYFRASSGVNGYELWRSDGTTGGTQMVADIYEGYGSSMLLNLTNLNGVLYFIADNGVDGYELWASDGTEAGTFMVKDIMEGAQGSEPQNLTVMEDTLFFTADDGAAGRELWSLTSTNTPPTISAIDDQDTYDNGHIGPIAFTINDLENDPATLTIDVSSSDPAILPNNFDANDPDNAANNIIVGGTGANRTITLIPALDHIGTVTVTVTVSDGELSTAEVFSAEWWPAKVVSTETGPGVDYDNLYDALIDASDGDTVLLKDGVYTSPFYRSVTKNITIRSENGPEYTIIDLEYNDNGFIFRDSGQHVSISIEGLTITRGVGSGIAGAVRIMGDVSATFDNCVFSRNISDIDGGAISILDGSSTVITNCLFLRNIARNGGAISVSSGGSLTVSRCHFVENSTGAWGWGGAIVTGGDTKIENSVFEGNTAGASGGAINAATGSKLKVWNSFFENNLSRRGFGGAIRSYGESMTVAYSVFTENKGVEGGAIHAQDNPIITNCSFSGNNATESGGALYFSGEINNQIFNTILWGNTAGNTKNQIAMDRDDYYLTIKYSNLEGGLNGIKYYYLSGSPTNIDSEYLLNQDPEFALTADLHLMPDSPCIDAGTAGPPGDLPSRDMDGHLVSLDGDGDGTPVPDIGAYEFDRKQFAALGLSHISLSFMGREGSASPDDETMFIRNRGLQQFTWAVSSEYPSWLRAEPSEGNLSPGEKSNISVYLDLQEASSLSHGFYSAVLDLKEKNSGIILEQVTVWLNITTTLNVPSTDYPTIQKAIDAAIDGDTVLVSDGEYTGIGNVDLRIRGNNIKVQSANGPNYTTINCGTNSRAFSLETGTSSIIDGFSIVNGFTSSSGGAIYVGANSSPTIINCRFVNNNNDNIYGGAIYIGGAGTTLRNCEFINNGGEQNRSAGRLEIGGAVYIYGGANDTLIEDCSFVGNSANEGGAINLTGDGTVIKKCEFTQNQALGTGEYDYGGGAIISRANPGGVGTEIIGCTFRQNSSSLHGGAISFTGLNRITNCIFYDNTADNTGGGLYSEYSGDGIITNCVFYNNKATQGSGGGIYIYYGLDSEVTNCILWNNTAGIVSTNQIYDPWTESPVSYSFVDQDGYGNPDGSPDSDGNIRYSNPLFADPLNGDFRLQPDSPCIDKGKIVEWLFSDWRGSLRPIDGDGDGKSGFDIGAFEYSKYYGGIEGDLPAVAFKDLTVGTSMVVTNFDYNIQWKDRDPFPSGDLRVHQAGEYGVNLALVNDHGLRINLGTYTVEVSQLGYKIPYTFGSEHKGFWRLRLELTSDPNQYVLSDEFSIEYKAASPYYLGKEIKPPEGADTTQKPEVEKDHLVYWSAETNRLFAIGPGTTVVTWYQDELREVPIPVVAQLVYPPNPQIHIAGTQPTVLLSSETRFDGVEKKYADNDASLSGNQFTATQEGYTVLLFRDADAQDPDNKEIFEVVRTLTWNHKNVNVPSDPVLPLEKVADIGTAVTDTAHNATCGNGYVFFEGAFYDGLGESSAYDRDSRQGPIFPVNRDLSGPIVNESTDPIDDLVVVWYQMSSVSGVCWPAVPVRYDPQWPADARTIVIASQQGSGPLTPDKYGIIDNMLIYNQPDRGLPGYNPNEEHAAFFTAQGSEYPAVFPLRTDLNRFDISYQENTSEPYVLLKYREPLSGEWSMEVYKVVAQSDRYKEDGTISQPATDADRYCLNNSGQLITQSACTPGESYYLDASGYLVNTAETDSCYQYSTPGTPGGVISLTSCPGDQYELDESGVLETRGNPPSGFSVDQYGVLVDSDTYYRFHYSGTAGNEINAPYPLNQFVYGPCPQSYINPSTMNNALKDKDNKLFAFQGDVDIKLHYFYKLRAGFFYDVNADNAQDRPVGTCIPWLEGLDGTFEHLSEEPGEPVATIYAIHWPDPVPSLFVGETLVDAKTQKGESIGLPEIGNQCKVDVLYDQPVVESGMDFSQYSVNLIDPLLEYGSDPYPEGQILDPEKDLPQTLKPRKDLSAGRWVFTALPYHLQSRLTYDEVTKKVKLKGVYDDTGAGEPLLLLNVLSERELDMIDQTMPDADEDTAKKATFLAKVNDANNDAKQALRYPINNYASLKDAELKGLTAGDAHGTGYVTLAFNNHEDCAAPTVLSVIRVRGPLYEGEIKVVESPNPFEEKVTLRHNGDFGGNSDLRSFQWKYTRADFSGIPCRPGEDDTDTCVQRQWEEYEPLPSATQLNPPGEVDPFFAGAVDAVVQGTGEQLLPDKWFAVHYYYPNADYLDKNISTWTKPQLYEGWIKRVMKKINLFDQKVTDFHTAEANTLASMISLAGQRYEGDIALSDEPEYLQSLGIIEVYETLLNRGRGLTEDGGDFTDLNKALLFAANRLADLYMLLGNEAYADAVDPTIGFSTEDGLYGIEAPSIFCFQNQVDTLLDEELALLRGRDNEGVRPFYNRMVWNFTLGDGETAYKENYNITDHDEDGDVDEYDAMIRYPQGHGDAWGHYLSAVKKYYELLKRENFTWFPQSEFILVAGTPVNVDYRDERKFAQAAAARAKAGAEIVNLSYRKHYTADPEGQWQGYKDVDAGRAWGVDGWARRAGQGALFDWVTGNALLPSVDTLNEGIAKIDRTTVVDLWDVTSSYASIENEVDKADAGLNPLGLARDAIPFDIDPARVANGETHFEQIYGRAVQAMNNAIAVFNHANQSSQLLRRQQDSLADFRRNIENMEADYTNRLIEVFGYPYPDDCGSGKTYSTEYCETGPDLYHYMYVDSSELMGEEAPKVHEFIVDMAGIDPENPVDDAGQLQYLDQKQVKFHVATDSRFGIMKPPEWLSRRKAPGEIQFARSDLLQTRGRFEKALLEYDNLISHIESQAELIKAQHGLNREEISILDKALNKQKTLNMGILGARTAQFAFRNAAVIARAVADAAAEAVPQVTGAIVGFSNGVIIDSLSGARGAAKGVGVGLAEAFNAMAEAAGIVELGIQQAKEVTSAETNIDLTALRGGFAVEQQLLQLENLVRSEATLRHELYILYEGLQQAANRYLAALAKGDRLLQDRLRFRKQTAAQIVDYRYKDMTFRIFRNDALEKYRAQFDMAAMYVFLAAKAYDYETTLMDYESMAGQHFLNDIVRQRTIGMIEGGQPLTGTGLADPMKRMWQNFQVLKPQLGFNNPQEETNRFSLRQELFRIRMDEGSNDTWRQVLKKYWVEDLWTDDTYGQYFRRYCRPFGAEGVVEPGIVIPFSTTVTSGLNFYRWPLGGGDSYYDSSNFATKVRSVGVWFSNYNSTQLAQTPRIYLIPVGEDVLRPPSYDVSEIRSWHVVDQKLPIPFPIVQTEMEGDSGWIPMVDTLFDEPFQIRRHSRFRAYHDSGYVNESEMTHDTRLIGRSVWNNRWLLIIPGRSLLYDPDEGLERFINGPELIGGSGERTGNGISDIKLFFHTYAYSGN